MVKEMHQAANGKKIEEEIAAIFDFMKHVYGIFGFDFHLELSTRPDKYLGAIETWDAAEGVNLYRFLRDALFLADRTM